jgi:hypothetical protein
VTGVTKKLKGVLPKLSWSDQIQKQTQDKPCADIVLKGTGVTNVHSLRQYLTEKSV